MKKQILIWSAIIVLVVIAIGGFLVYQQTKNTQMVGTNPEPSLHVDNSTVVLDSPTPTASATPTATPIPDSVKITTDPATGRKIYTDTQYGFSFRYPATFNSAFVFFQPEPKAIVSAKNSKDIDAKGCYQLDIAHQESIGSVGGISFCESSGGDPGAGQLYSSYYYTVLHNQHYITLAYVIHTPNGCDAYKGTSNYQNCVDFFDHITQIALDPIRDSAATLKFTK